MNPGMKLNLRAASTRVIHHRPPAWAGPSPIGTQLSWSLGPTPPGQHKHQLARSYTCTTHQRQHVHGDGVQVRQARQLPEAPRAKHHAGQVQPAQLRAGG